MAQLSFFTSDEFGVIDNPIPEAACGKCKLFKKVKSPNMEVGGDGRLKCLIIAEAPGEEEDEKGTQLVGKAGNLLFKKLRIRGLNLHSDFWKINSVNCRPFDKTEKGTKNVKPTKTQIKCCKPKVDKAIKDFQPNVIWLMGGDAVESFYGGRFSRVGITRWRGYMIPDYSVNAWIVPMYHPSYMLRNEKNLNLEVIYDSDIDLGIKAIKTPLSPQIDFKKAVNRLTSFDDITALLRRAAGGEWGHIFFDYETTGLKPENRGHRIASCSFAVSPEEAYSFPIQYKGLFTPNQEAEIIGLWGQTLSNPNIQKSGQNIKFEERWSRRIIKTRVMNWLWCTMTATHILDSRSDISGLKFQIYRRWGLEGYNKLVDKYLAPAEGKEFNTIDECPLEDLLLYGGIDSAGGYKLLEAQFEEFENSKPGTLGNLSDAYDLFHDGLGAFADLEEEGICSNLGYYESKSEELSKRITSLTSSLMLSEEAILFRQKEGKDINLNSHPDISKLVFTHLQYPAVILTGTNKPSTSEEALEQVKLPFVKKLIQLRKLEKLHGTYVAQFIRETGEDGKIHAFINLHTARTHRSSISNPSIQNIPVRDELAKKTCRVGIEPSKGNMLVEIDFGSIEVKGAACYTHDKNLIKYINNPSTCMHRDQGAFLWMLEKDQMTKDIRFYAKNQFVFPEFYGSYWKSCAKNLWKECIDLLTADNVRLGQHILNVGIARSRESAFADFEKHVQKCERQFWGRFPEFKEWQNSVVKFHAKHGYVELLTGFRRSGFLSRNEIFNTPIQGAAFHMLLWSLIQLNKIARKDQWRSKIISQIHDSILIDMYPKELNNVIRIAKQIMTEDIREHWKWIIVPLTVEVEATPVDGNWYEKAEIKC